MAAAVGLIAPVALAAPVEKVGGVVVALVAAVAVLSSQARTRAWATLAALVLAPALLIGEIYHTGQFATFRDHPGLSVAGGVVALGLLLVAAWGLRRRPGLFPVLAVLVLPFRVPIGLADSTVNLLVPLYAVIAAGALAFIVPGIRAAGDAERPRPATPAAVALMAFVVLYGIQALYSADVTNALDQLVFFYVPFALLYAVLAQSTWTPRITAACLWVLVAVALSLVAVGFVEYATRRLLLNPKVIDANNFTDYFRVNSLFFDPNIYGRFLALVMLAVTSVVLWTRQARLAWGGALVLAVLWAGLVLTFSQSSFAALLCGLAVLAATRWDPRRTAIATGVALVVALVAVVAGQSALKLNLRSASSVNRGTTGRLNLVKGGLSMFGDRPVQGWGSGSFATVYRNRSHGSTQRAVSASHTIPVTVAAEQGIPGLVAYAFVLALAFRLLLRRARDGPLRAYLLAAFSALVLHTLVYAAFLEDPTTWTLLGIAAALPP